ncbi:MAG: hypothetical protein HYY07_01280, partial [Elusimicrobia bacterium]|nr:hypothetical protein [Elusimicrobiota bacterium]
MTVSYYYDTGNTRLKTGDFAAAYGVGSTKSTDAFGGTTNSNLRQKFTSYRNQAKLHVSETDSYTANADGSKSWMGWDGKGKTLTVTYKYTEDGKLVSGEGQAATGHGESLSDDGFQNTTKTVLDQLYTAVRGQAKLTYTKSVSDTVFSWDGAKSSQTMEMYYAYDVNGKLVTGENGDAVFGGKKKADGSYDRRTFGEGISRAEDQWGNSPTIGFISQTYEVVKGQAKLKVSTTVTASEDLVKKIILKQHPQSELAEEHAQEGSYGSGYVTSESINVASELMNSATVDSLIRDIGTVSVEGQIQTMTITYEYNQKTGEPIGAVGHGDFVSNDGFGNLMKGTLDQTFVIVGGQAKLKTNTTKSWSIGSDGSGTLEEPGKNLDGSSSYSEMTVTYSYYGESAWVDGTHKLGQMAGATGTGNSKSNDGFDNITDSKISQTFEIIKGQARLKISETKSMTTNFDDSKSYMGWPDGPDGSGEVRGKAMVVTYNNSQVTGLLVEGTGLAAHGEGTSVSIDAFDSVTTAWMRQDFTSVKGQAKVTLSITRTDAFHKDAQGKLVLGNWDGSKSWSGTIVYTRYDADGHLVGVNSTKPAVYGNTQLLNEDVYSDRKYGDSITSTRGVTVFRNDDIFGNVSWGNNQQTFYSINGQSKVASSVNSSYSNSFDGSYSETHMTVNSTYNTATGVLTNVVSVAGTTYNQDSFGNITRGTITQVYEVYRG